jgi:hypothetical protein
MFRSSIPVLFAALAVTALSGAALAQPTPSEACRTSALTLCPTEVVARDRPAVRACLVQNWDKVAPDCKAAILAARARAAKP